MIIDEPEPEIKLKENISLTEYESIFIKKLLMDYCQNEDINSLNRLIELCKEYIEINDNLKIKLLKNKCSYRKYKIYEKLVEIKERADNPLEVHHKYNIHDYIKWKQDSEIRSRDMFNIVLIILKKLNFDFSMINLIDNKEENTNDSERPN